LWANGLPHANLSIGPENPYTLQLVTANATNSTDDGPIAWYKFDFGDGFKTQWQKGAAAAHEYKDEGTYNITALVKDNMSAISAPVTMQVLVLNRAPVANASAAVLQAYTYVDISFNGVRSFDPDGKITLKWDFGDGATSIDPKPIHNWTDNGVYNITLKVTDDDGATNSTTLKMTILDQAPTASFTANLYRGNVTTPFQFKAAGNDRDGTIAKWVWDFGDGNKSSEQNPMHHYGNDGSYNVSFYVEDDDGTHSSVLNRTVIIDNLPPVVNFTVSTLTAFTYEDIIFKDLSTDLDGRIVTLNWDLGDGKMFKDPTLTHQYKENGVFTVKLTVQDDDDALSTKEVQITIKNRGPVAKAVFNASATVGDLLVMTANQSTDMDGTIKFYTWTFNGTEEKRGQTITYAFWDVGVHNFTLTVQDNDGATNTVDLTITILKKPPPPKPPIIGGSLDPFTLLLIIILIGCVVGAVIGAVYFNKKKSHHKAHPGADKVATVPLTTSMDIDNASVGKSAEPEQKFESAYQYQAYGKVEAYPFYGKEVEAVAPAYDYGPGYDQTGTAEPELATQEVEAIEPVEEEPPQAPIEEPEEEEIPLKPVVVEHDAVASRVAEPEKEPEARPDDSAKKAKEKEIKEANDLDEILGLLNESK
jgi:PKD repeat protein